MSVSLAVYVWIRDIDGILLKIEFAQEDVASMLAAIFKVCNIKSVLHQLHVNC